MFDLNYFIGKYVTKRTQSMFLKDMRKIKKNLFRKLKVIGSCNWWSRFYRVIVHQSYFTFSSFIVGSS